MRKSQFRLKTFSIFKFKAFLNTIEIKIDINIERSIESMI
jgi:hypothetical protein